MAEAQAAAAPLTCDVCGQEPAVEVAAVPGVPISVSYGPKCLAANAHPYGVLVANTAMLGGLFNTSGWWVQMVNDTLTHLGRTLADFDRDVHAFIRDLDEDPHPN